MIKYWPNQQNIHLNNAIVELFFEIEKKLVLNNYNKSNQYLYLDILNTRTRTQLLQYVLSEFKTLVLDLIEINLKHETLNKFSNKIEKIFIYKTYEKFIKNFNCTTLKHNKNTILDCENKSLIEYLLTYLIFGSCKINHKIFIFEPNYTPYHQVKILLEHFIIEIGNNITKVIINSLTNTHNINSFLKRSNICNKLYTSNRSIILFTNNLKWQAFIKSYIYEVKSLYNERQQIWIIGQEGILTKYIYISREKESKNLKNIKVIFILWLEIKDLFIPKIEKLIIQIFKYFLYCSINLFSNTIIILVKVMIFYLKV
uniref:Uncharacterized protein n=1 Tax=Polysiphonia scopulorum TaxID=257860 RepID=A0A1Z1MI58_9FLOR|nr:hypothetical protein [Polysiphonia scopulorum]ARW65505.1 hypothetical protein [Polysiphonia scopulorum]